MNPRNRIVGHRIVRARDLIPHALNPRTHSEGQKQALSDLLGEVGFARSTLAYVADEHRRAAEFEGKQRALKVAEQCGNRVDEILLQEAYASALREAPLTLIDGHLRRDTLPDAEITVEVLDVDDEEARKLLLSIDPLSSLAGYDETALSELKSTVATESDALSNLWASVADAQKAASRVMEEARKDREPKKQREEPEQYLVIIECDDERHQVDTLRWVKARGAKCKAVMS